MSQSTYTCIANSGKPRADRELSEMIQERMQHEPDIGNLEIAIAQLYKGENADGPSNTYSQYRQTELTKRSEDCLVIERSEIVNKSIDAATGTRGVTCCGSVIRRSNG